MEKEENLNLKKVEIDISKKQKIEEYEQILFNPELDTNGKIINFSDYDNKMFEYLYFYGSKEVDIDKKIKLFQNIINNSAPENLIGSKAYSSYFMTNCQEDNKKIANRFEMEIIKDILARIYEYEREDIPVLRNNEEEIVKRFLPTTLYIEGNQEKSKIMSNNETKNMARGKIEECIGNLFEETSEQTIEIARYIIRLQNKFDENNRPKNDKLAIIYDYIKNIDIFETLKENLNKIHSNEKKGDINEKGLKRIDYADKALALMLESNFDKGVHELGKEENIQIFKENGRDIYDSKAIRKLVELYVERPSFQNYSPEKDNLIYKYVLTVTSKSNFNLFKEQGVSDLLQLYSTRFAPNGENIKNLCQIAIIKNLRYDMSVEEATKYVNEFIKKVGNNVVKSSEEVQFDKFLDALTKIRIFSKESLIPENATDFILMQAIMKDSIINTMSEKYSCVTERALENLGKLDYKRLNSNSQLTYIYITRDHLDKEKEIGCQNSGEKCIRIKRELLSNLYSGRYSAINIMFHENTHMRQRLNKDITKSFEEYMMLKELIIKAKDIKYYYNNYEQAYEEIDAREKANIREAEYIEKLISKYITFEQGKDANEDIMKNITEELQKEKSKLILETEKEKKLYKEGLYKFDQDGKKRTINEIFDRTLTDSEIFNYMISHPILNLEYQNYGDRRTLSEQIMCANKYKDMINIQMMREIIKNSVVANSVQPIKPLLKTVRELINDAQNEKDLDFVNGIVGDNMPTVIKKYALSISTRKKYGINIPDIRQSYLEIRDFLEFAKKDSKAINVENLKIPNENGNSLIEMLENIKSEFEKNFLNEIADNVEQRKFKDKTKKGKLRFFQNSYEQLRGIQADIRGKEQVRDKEEKLRDKEDKEEKNK